MTARHRDHLLTWSPLVWRRSPPRCGVTTSWPLSRPPGPGRRDPRPGDALRAPRDGHLSRWRTGNAPEEQVTLFDLPTGAAVAAFLLLSAMAHLIVITTRGLDVTHEPGCPVIAD